MRTVLPALLALGCGSAEPETAPAPPVAEVVDFRQVVPGPGLPLEVAPDAANNNLDIAWHEDRLFLAFRTGPWHFASPDVKLHVVSSADEETWRFEGSFSMDTDLREPQLVSWQGELHLFFAVLGDNSLDFDPQGARVARRTGIGTWTEPEAFADPTFIPWRIKEVDGALHMIGYTGGANVYEAGGDPIEIRWLRSDDARTWTPVVPNHEVVLSGGGSEADYAILDDGSLVAVVRNEAGEDGVFGSYVCTAPAGSWYPWTCSADPRKYDSPLVFRRDGRVWLVARRNLTDDGTGHYDLDLPDMDHAEQYLFYQVTYWNLPKRCALWEVLPEARQVRWVLDLPSRGDTCFPEAVDLDGEVLLYNYSSDPDGPDLSWLEGQTGETGIYRQILRF